MISVRLEGTIHRKSSLYLVRKDAVLILKPRFFIETQSADARIEIAQVLGFGFHRALPLGVVVFGVVFGNIPVNRFITGGIGLCVVFYLLVSVRCFCAKKVW